MKLWSHICFLVLATSSRSRGEEALTEYGDKDSGASFLPTTDKTQNVTLPTSHSPSNDATAATTSGNTTQVAESSDNDWEAGNSTDMETTSTAGVIVNASRWSSVAVDTTAVSKTTRTSEPGATTEAGSEGYSPGGYALLVIIVLLIVALCAVLYMLRRSSRTYSFDLQRPLPVNYASEPTGTFEPVQLDDLEPPAQLDDVATDDLSPPAVGNGTSAQSEESSSNGLKSAMEQQDANGLGTGPASPPVSDQSAESPLDSATLLSSGALEEPQNENNNHPLCSSDLFVDININEPTWSDLHIK